MNATERLELLKITKKELNYIVACILQQDVKTASGITSQLGTKAITSAVGMGASAGAIALVTAFGTASTGTAISALSGAAATNAALAVLGGGTLAAGGLGVLGGTIATGGLGLVAGYGAYRLLKSKPRDYESLPKIDKEVVASCSMIIKAIDQALNNNTIPSVQEFQELNKLLIQPLYKKLTENKQDIISRLDKKNDFAFDVNALPDFKKNVVIPFSEL